MGPSTFLRIPADPPVPLIPGLPYTQLHVAGCAYPSADPDSPVRSLGAIDSYQ